MMLVMLAGPVTGLYPSRPKSAGWGPVGIHATLGPRHPSSSPWRRTSSWTDRCREEESISILEIVIGDATIDLARPRSGSRPPGPDAFQSQASDSLQQMLLKVNKQGRKSSRQPCREEEVLSFTIPFKGTSLMVTSL